MRLPIAYRLFIAVLLVSLALTGAVIAVVRLSVVRSFADYVAQIELGRLDPLVGELQARYRETGDWDFLPPAEPAEARVRWLRRELDRTVAGRPRPGPPPPRGDGQRPPPAGPPDHLSLHDRVSLLGADGRWLAGRRDDVPVRARRPLWVDGQVVGYLALARVVEPADAIEAAFLADQLRHIALIGGLAVLASVIAAALLAGHFRRPIGRLLDGARALAAGRFETRLAITRSDELGELARSFNHLAAMLERHESSRRQWLADTSHELRTPLAVLRAQTEALQDGVRPADAANLAALHRQALILGKLVDDLYALARSDVGQLQYRMARLEPWPLVQQEAEALAPRLAERGLALVLQPPESAATVFGDADRLRQLLRNLLENSARYTDAGGEVRIRAERVNAGHGNAGRGNAAWRLVVEDSAPAVPAELLARLGERFFRAEASRSRAHGGAGLGLALCVRIAAAHHGRLDFASSPLAGCASP
ncbi:ATP-binding protein [Chitinimonas koreensis]|uniref:ATP-binding protein n=1 Tax=Chitinimonas koreensis TaxID=356302 RepID=UPI00165459CA|nr:ATP-binding protein [Chitinimonas koreensis]QNM95291.1 HAMP domain-containing protein [Chitinimonas koreensis]